MFLVKKIMMVVAGSILVGIGVNVFLVPHQLLDGGMIGIGLLAKYYFDLKPGLIVLLLSLPIYILVFLFDRNLFYNSFHGLLLSSCFIDMLSPLREWNVFSISFSAISGGVLIGSGIGIMLAYKSNTGGTDLLAQFIAIRLKLPVALLIFAIDGLIIAMSFEVIGMEKTVYSLLTIITVALCTHYFSQIDHTVDDYVVVGPIVPFKK